MAWSNFPVVQSEDWTAEGLMGVLSQLWYAAYERWRALSYTEQITVGNFPNLIDLLNSPDFAAETTWWYDFQAIIMSMVQYYVVSHASVGSPYPKGYYDGALSIPTWTVTTIRAAAGIDSGGFKRITPAGTYYGMATLGDFIHPDSFNELQKILNLMVWHPGPIVWDYSGPDHNVAGVGPEPYLTWTATKNFVNIHWPNSYWSAYVEPGAYSYGTKEYVAPDTLFNAATYRSWNYGHVGYYSFGGKSARIDYYVLTNAYDAKVWNGNGDIPAGYEDEWYAFAYEDSLPIMGVSPDPLGDPTLTQPAWCAEPSIGSDTGEGWALTDTCGICRWNKSGGFSYQ